MSTAVGADIESLCSKCGDVWHVVVAKVGETIAKVQCKQCGAQHRHKPPAGAPADKRSAGAVRRSPGAKGKSKAKAKDAPSVEVDPTRPVRTYLPSESYEPGDRIAHVQFGSGVVESSPGPGKMQVFFPGGRRILVQSRSTRPA